MQAKLDLLERLVSQQPDRTGGKHPVAAAALEAGKTADAWLERRQSSDAERSSTPTSRRRGA